MLVIPRAKSVDVKREGAKSWVEESAKKEEGRKGERLTFVTASWKWSSLMGEAVLLEKAKWMFRGLGPAGPRRASMSTRRFVLLTIILCSCGLLGVSAGSAEAKFHSSSSFETVGFGGGAGEAAAAGAPNGAGLEDEEPPVMPKAARFPLPRQPLQPRPLPRRPPPQLRPRPANLTFST